MWSGVFHDLCDHGLGLTSSALVCPRPYVTKRVVSRSNTSLHAGLCQTILDLSNAISECPMWLVTERNMMCHKLSILG